MSASEYFFDRIKRHLGWSKTDRELSDYLNKIEMAILDDFTLSLGEERQNVLIEMTILGFDMIKIMALIKEKDYGRVSAEILKSPWAFKNDLSAIWLRCEEGNTRTIN